MFVWHFDNEHGCQYHWGRINRVLTTSIHAEGIQAQLWLCICIQILTLDNGEQKQNLGLGVNLSISWKLSKGVANHTT